MAFSTGLRLLSTSKERFFIAQHWLVVTLKKNWFQHTVISTLWFDIRHLRTTILSNIKIDTETHEVYLKMY